MQTPWGISQHTEKIAYGITAVSTASHGGIKVSPTLNMKIPGWLKECTHNKQGLEGWYEEDCDWCIPALVYHNDFCDWAYTKGKKRKDYLDLAEQDFTKYILEKVKIPTEVEGLKKKGLVP